MLKTLVLVSGKLRSGKNTFSDFLQEYAEKEGLIVKQGLFAKALKQSCLKDFQALSVFLQGEYSRLSEHGIPHEEIAWMDVKSEHFFEDKTALTRILLQLYGTEIFRNRVDENYWVNTLLQEFNQADADLFIVTDTRFPNEITIPTEWAEKSLKRVSTVRIHRSSLALTSAGAHSSETALDEFPVWDYVYNNDGSLEDMKAAARDYLLMLRRGC